MDNEACTQHRSEGAYCLQRNKKTDDDNSSSHLESETQEHPDRSASNDMDRDDSLEEHEEVPSGGSRGGADGARRKASGDSSSSGRSMAPLDDTTVGGTGGERLPRAASKTLRKIRPHMTLAEMERLDEEEDLRDRPFSGIGPHNAEQVRRMEMLSKRASGTLDSRRMASFAPALDSSPIASPRPSSEVYAESLPALGEGSGVCCEGDAVDPSQAAAEGVTAAVAGSSKDPLGECFSHQSGQDLEPTAEAAESIGDEDAGDALSLANQSLAPSALKGGSLLRMFESSAFDAYLHMYYLYKKPESGVQQYLVNMLYTKRSDADVHFYLPQLCCLSVERYKTSDLNRFLLARASKAMHIAVKVSWLFQSFADGTTPERDSNSQSLTQEVEMACVNSTPFPPGTAAPPSEDQDQTVPDLFERRKIITKLQRSAARRQQEKQQELDHLTDQDEQYHQELCNPPIRTSPRELEGSNGIAQEIPSNLVTPASYSSPQKESPALLPASEHDGDSSSNTLLTPEQRPTASGCDEFVLGTSARMEVPTGSALAQSSSSSSRLTTPASSAERSVTPSSTNLKHRVRRGFVRFTGETTLSGSRVRLPSPYVKLGTPWNYSAFKDASLMDEELQPFIVKQRRCDYFNLLMTLSMMLIEASNLLSTEPDRSLRLPLLQRFLESLNEWMCCRRCVVAASEGIFAMTGLNVPLFEFGSLLPTGTTPHSTQIVRFLPQECKVLSSKKRAPYLLVYEVADLDEDLRRLPSFFRLGTVDFDQRTRGRSDWDHLYVYRCILHELKQRGLYTPTANGTQESPLAELQAALLPTRERRHRRKDEHHHHHHQQQQQQQHAAQLCAATTVAPAAPAVPLPAKDALPPTHNQEDPVQVLENTHHVPPEQTARPSTRPSSSLPQPHQLNTPRSDEHSEAPSRDASAASDSAVPDFVIPRSKRRQGHSSKKTASGSNPKTGGYSGWTSVLGLGGNRHSSSVAAEDASKRRGSAKAKTSPSELAANARKLRQKLWGKTWAEKKAQYRQESPYGSLKSWNMACVMVKGGDDLRQEMLASQLIQQFKLVFDAAGLPLYLRPYEILVTGPNCGVMVFVPDTVSIDSLKKTYGSDSVADVFDAAFADNPYEAKKNFIQSHAAYSIIGYLLQVKDRHNGNYLLDCEGHIIHIDYGFMLSNCPGYFGWESSPFKLTAEFLDVMDGEFSDNYDYFRTLVVRGFLEARKHVDKFALLIEMMMSAYRMPCFTAGPDVTVAAFRERFLVHLTEQACVNKIVDMIDISVNNWRSVHYDNFQRLTNGII